MPRREAAIAGSVQPLDLRLLIHGHPFGRRTPQPTVQQVGRALFLVTAAPATEGPFADPEQLARIDLVGFARLMTVQHAPETDYPHVLTSFRPAHPGSPKRPKSPDRSCATDRAGSNQLARRFPSVMISPERGHGTPEGSVPARAANAEPPWRSFRTMMAVVSR